MRFATAARRRSFSSASRWLPAVALAIGAGGTNVACADPAAQGSAAGTSGDPTVVFGNGDAHVVTTGADVASPSDTRVVATTATAATTTPDAGPALDTTAVSDTAAPDTTAPEVGGGCGEQTLALTQVTPASVLLVVDRSNSMKGTKWADAKTAIGEIAAAYEATLRLGLLLFPQAWNDCSVSPVADVPLALSNSADVKTTLNTAPLFLSTPTTSAIVAAGEILDGAPHDAPRIIVLATDGQPTCPMGCGTCTGLADGACLGGSCDLCIDVHACVAHQLTDAVDALAGKGILTYVVGLPGSEVAADTLNAVADAGGTALPGATRYYRASDAATLADTLGTIAGQVTSCSAPVTPVGGAGFATIHINGGEIDRDPNHHDGWDLLNGNTVQFYGPACSAAAAPGADVSITWGCKH